MKKILCVFIALLMLMLSSCSKGNSGNQGEIVCSYNRPTFDTIGGLIEHLTIDDNAVKAEIQSNATHNARGVKKDALCMYVPSFEPDGYQLNNVALSGSWIYYEYYADGYSLYSTPESNSAPQQQEDKATPGEDIINEPPTSSNLEFFSSQEYQVTDVMLAEIENTFSIGWAYYANSGSGLEEFIRTNYEVVSELENHPGVYYSDTPFPDQTYGKMLYWVQDGYDFQASMSLEVFESITFSEDGIPELAQPVDYSTKTFKMVE